MGVVGAAIKGFGKALKVGGRNKASKKLFKDASGGLKYPVIKSVKPAKNLTSRRKEQQQLFKSVDDQYKKVGVKPGPETKASEIKVSAAKRSSKIHDKHEKAISDAKKYNKNLKRKVIGGASASVAGIVGAHGAAKHKFPKYKKFMERDIKIKDGKVTLVPKKKK
jgi:hypothetical protein